MRLTFKRYDVLIRLDLLTDSPYQTNTHPQNQIEILAKVMKEQGVRQPIHVTRGTNRICFGHGRKAAALLNGWTEFPVVYQTFTDESEEILAVTNDNALAMRAEIDMGKLNSLIPQLDPDTDINLFGLEDFTIDVAEKYDEEKEDEVPEVKGEPISKLGDVYILGNHRLICGDSTDILQVEKLMDGNKASLGFCDPPYNLGFKYNEYDDNKTDKEYEDFSFSWFNVLSLVTLRQIVTLGTKNIQLMSKLGDVSGVGCWVKKNWITSCKIAKLQQWEPIFHYGDFTKHKRTSDLYEINRVVQKDVGNDHTCPKQIKLIVEILDSYADKSVVDLFGGSGTTLIACEKTNRSCYMMELDPHYCDVIVSRYMKYANKDSVNLNGTELQWSKEVENVRNKETNG